MITLYNLEYLLNVLQIICEIVHSETMKYVSLIYFEIYIHLLSLVLPHFELYFQLKVEKKKNNYF